MIRILVLLCLTLSSAHAALSPTDVTSVIERARKINLDLREKDTQKGSEGKDYWNLPSYLGTHYLSQYQLLLAWLGQSSTRLNTLELRSRLAAEQLSDGSWYAIADTNLHSGDLNATILNYLALKAQGAPLESALMSKARAYILAKGGMEKASIFTKIVAALFGNFPWNEIPTIPYLVFMDGSPYNMSDFGQWIAPHLMPIAYLRSMELSKDLGPNYTADELFTHPAKIAAFRANGRSQPKERHFPHLLSGDSMLINKILRIQQPAGSMGGYTIATLLSIAALDDFQTYMPNASEVLSGKTKRAISAGFTYTEEMYLNSGEGRYKGVTDDGRYWDTALMGISLSENDAASADLRSAGEYLVSRQSNNGGFAFGLDFEYSPDTDDTAEIIIFLNRLNKSGGGFEKPILSAAKWLKSMQNSDGGWGAFSRNNTGNGLLRSFAKDFTDSADLFDESSPDVTGHILEALSGLGMTSQNSKTIQRAMQYLHATQDPQLGAWFGRWGINYIYGTCAATVGLIRAGESPGTPALNKAITWLRSRQNSDGGFGETTASYDDKKLAGVGLSTPSQTAWALITLTEAGLASTDTAEKAASYLVTQFNAGKKWSDPSTVGTGHPSIVYMNYPSYPYVFPLIALSRYQRALNQNGNHQAD